MPQKTTKIQRSPIDDYQRIAQSAQFTTWAFAELREKNDYPTVQSFRVRVEQIFQRFDRAWCQLVGDDEHELILWGSRMRVVRENLDRLDRSLAFAGQRQFNWDEVLSAMGLLDALRVATEQTLQLNEYE